MNSMSTCQIFLVTMLRIFVFTLIFCCLIKNTELYARILFDYYVSAIQAFVNVQQTSYYR